MKMTDEQHKSLSAYVDELALLLGRGDWDIELSPKLTGRKAHKRHGINAMCFTQHDSPKAMIEVSPWLMEQSPETIRRTLTHELLHTYTGHLATHIMDSFAEVVSPVLWQSFDTAYQRLMERSVDQLAFHLAELLPLPA